MEFNLLVKGFLIGLSISAPVGPIGALCISRTITKGRLSGLFSGLGAALADTCYGAAAALSLGLLESLIMEHQFWFRFLGGLFLLCMGGRILLSRKGPPQARNGRRSRKGLIGDFISTFFLTLTNPMTILAFAAIFAGLGIHLGGEGWLNPLLLVSGVFSGASAWWLFLCLSVGWLKGGMSEKVRIWINRSSGLVVIGFGMVALLAAFLV